MAWDQGYEQDWGYDPYGGQQGYEPYGGEWAGYDPYGGYASSAYPQPPQEDTESAKLRKEDEVKKRREALESNRLYLKKIKKKCVKEDFADLEGERLFLFELLVESLEVRSATDGQSLGLIKEGSESYVTVRAQILNSPYLEICEKDMVAEGNSLDEAQVGTEYVQSVNDAGIQDAFTMETHPPLELSPSQHSKGTEEGEKLEETILTTKWENASGKSCLFSRSALQMVQDLGRSPVVLQVVRVAAAPAPEENEEGQEDVGGSEPAPRRETALPPSEVLGYVRLRLPDEFSLSVLQSCRPGVILPVGCAHRQKCTIHSPFGSNKGEMELFLRLSCFGPAIVTSFRTSGADRRYVFKPSPIIDLPMEREREPARAEVLRPIVAEEPAAVGPAVMRAPDPFQKPVVWRSAYRPAGADDLSDLDGLSDLLACCESGETIGSGRIPRASDISLCKTALAGKTKKLGQTDMCDWHSLVGLEVKNSPGGHCGCLSESVQEPARRQDVEAPPRWKRFSSRLAKMKVPHSYDLPFAGDGCSDCECDCPAIKEKIMNNKLFPM